jgi:hypothetical protein
VTAAGTGMELQKGRGVSREEEEKKRDGFETCPSF